MNLERILAIGGKPGLYNLVAQSRGGIIVESMRDGKRFPVSSSGNVSSLKDIAIYTYEEEIPLAEVYLKIAEKENFGPAPSHKESANTLRAYLEEVLPDYDKERVYNSDIKKLFNWYNILQEKGLITAEEAEEDVSEETQAETKTSEEQGDE